jgi:hypothetical protein
MNLKELLMQAAGMNKPASPQPRVPLLEQNGVYPNEDNQMTNNMVGQGRLPANQRQFNPQVENEIPALRNLFEIYSSKYGQGDDVMGNKPKY